MFNNDMIKDNYATDKGIMELFEGWFDPCPLNDNPEFDGLKIEWKDKTILRQLTSNQEVTTL